MTATDERNRKERRARRPRPTVREQRFASLCVRVAEEIQRREGEAPVMYLGRVRQAAARVEHEQRRAKRTAARDARKRNR